MSREKVHTLPDLLRTTSDTGAMVATLIEYADFSVIPALLDELKNTDQRKHGRFLDLISNWVDSAVRAPSQASYRLQWQHIARQLLHLFWFDLFDLIDCLSKVEERITVASEPEYGDMGIPVLPDYFPAELRVRAESDIKAGQWVTIDSTTTSVARLADNQADDPAPAEVPQG